MYFAQRDHKLCMLEDIQGGLCISSQERTADEIASLQDTMLEDAHKHNRGVVILLCEDCFRDPMFACWLVKAVKAELMLVPVFIETRSAQKYIITEPEEFFTELTTVYERAERSTLEQAGVTLVDIALAREIVLQKNPPTFDVNASAKVQRGIINQLLYRWVPDVFPKRSLASLFCKQKETVQDELYLEMKNKAVEAPALSLSDTTVSEAGQTRVVYDPSGCYFERVDAVPGELRHDCPASPFRTCKRKLTWNETC